MPSCCAFTSDNLASDGFSESKAGNNEIKTAFRVHAGDFFESSFQANVCARVFPDENLCADRLGKLIKTQPNNVLQMNTV